MATPLVSAAHNARATVTRSVSVVNNVATVNDSLTWPPFWVGISQSGTPRGFKYGGRLSDLSPRQAPPAMLRHAYGLTGPSSELGVGYRVNVLSYGAYELLDNGITLTTGRRTVAVEYAALPVDVLYPLDGILSDMHGNPISNMNLAIWNPFESHDINAGEYEDYEGEAPIEFGPSLKRNVDVMIGTKRYRILAAENDFGLMIVHLRLRKADEPLAS